MYENCRTHCSGAVPSSLRRPLAFPAMPGHTCRTGATPGPITPGVAPRVRVTPFLGSKWDGTEIIWSAPPGFSGPILIRGRQIGGSAAVGFGEGHVPYDELQIYAGPGSHAWPTFARVPGPGCYGFDIDTSHRTQTLVIEATT